MLFTAEEKDFFEKICAVSRKDKATVKEVLLAILFVATKQSYAAKYSKKEFVELTIPYICSLKWKYKDKFVGTGVTTNVEMDAVASNALIRELSCISDDVTTPTENYIKNLIANHIDDILELDIES